MTTESDHVPLRVDGRDYVLVPRADYVRMLKGPPEGVSLEEAKRLVVAEMGRGVRAAREHAGLTQAELAARLRVTQAMVSRAESGKSRISEAYIKRVLKACKLPADWRG